MRTCSAFPNFPCHFRKRLPGLIGRIRYQLRTLVCPRSNRRHGTQFGICNQRIEHILHCMRSEPSICMKKENDLSDGCLNPHIYRM